MAPDKMFRESTLLRHTSALSRYNARSLRHQYERAQLPNIDILQASAQTSGE